MSNPVSLTMTILEEDVELKDEMAQSLMSQLSDLDEVDTLERPRDPNPPAGHKGGGAFLAGVVKTVIGANGLEAVFGLLRSALGSRPIEVEVEANGKRLKVKAESIQDLEKALEQAQAFVNG